MSNRINGERVFCYSCENEWDRAHGGLQCPRCQSEFCEILENGRRPDADDPPEVLPEPPSDYDPLRGFYGHNPWAAPDPDDGDIRTVHFNSGGGGNGSTGYSFSRTYTFGGDRRDPPQQQRNRDPDYYPSLAAQETMRNFESMFTGLLGPAARVGGGHFGGSININGRTTTFGSGSFNSNTTTGPMPMGGLDLMSAIFPTTRNGGGIAGLPEIFQQYLNPANARSGDHVWSQEAFDRVLSQLMEQNAQNGAPPASEDRINALPKKKIDQSMLDNEGKAECSICMDSVEKDTEVTVLPCQHWFHFECIKSWLTEHDTCPHCRKPITPDTQQPTSPRPSGRRRLSRRSNSVASPVSQLRNPGSTDYGRQSPMPIAEDLSPSAMRSAREEYYGRSHQESSDERDQRPSSERRSSRRSTGSGTGRDDGGGVGGWIRNRMNFS